MSEIMERARRIARAVRDALASAAPPRYVGAVICDHPETLCTFEPNAYLRLDAPFSAIRSGTVFEWNGETYADREVTCVTVENVGYVVNCTRARFLELVRGDIEAVSL